MLQCTSVSKLWEKAKQFYEIISEGKQSIESIVNNISRRFQTLHLKNEHIQVCFKGIDDDTCVLQEMAVHGVCLMTSYEQNDQLWCTT